MGFLGNLFKKGEDPVAQCADATLGQLLWSEEDEAWFGEFDSLRFSLAYSGESQPSAAVLDYAREMLKDAAWLAASLAQAKEDAKGEFDKFYHPEVESLSFGRIHFYIHKGKRRILAELDGGKDYRCWRIEYDDRICEGMGFDS